MLKAECCSAENEAHDMLRFYPTGLAVAAVFYGFLWYAFERGPDYGLMWALAHVMLGVATAWLWVGVIAESPLGPLWPRRRARKGPVQGQQSGRH